jgi:segregation and condensation protein A
VSQADDAVVEDPSGTAPTPTTAKGPVGTMGTTLANVDVINHLLFHKAIISDDDDGSRINKYLEMVQDGEHLSMHDPFDRSVALAFELVMQEQLNPWDIDLVKFSSIYLERARKEDLDLVTAGRVILLAWSVLKLQSDDLVRRTEQRRQEPHELFWEDMPDFNFTDEDVDFTQRVRMAPRAPIDEKIWHEGDRKVTLMELVEAFETARHEASRRKGLAATRDAMRAERARAAKAFSKGRVHKEDLEADKVEIWRRISALNGDDIPLRRICDPHDLDDFVMAFNSVLFLHRDRRIDLWQEDFPYGTIYLRNREAAENAKAEAGS